MRKFVLVCLAFMTAEAFASKARVASLIGADHLVDTQTVFTIPSHIQLLNPYLTFEMGTAGTDAEAGVMRKVGSGNLMAYVGHKNTTTSATEGDTRTTNGFIGQQNPIEVIYGMGNMGFGGSISHFDSKSAGTKETTVIGKWGMNFNKDSWAWANVHLYSTAEKKTAGVKSDISPSPYLSGGVSYAMNTMRYFGGLDLGKGKGDITAGNDKDITDTNIYIGAEDRSLKTNTADIYYGATLGYEKRNYDGKALTAYALPVFVGIEAPLFSWLTVRASAQQNLLVGQTKDETSTPAAESGIASNTTVAAGLGFTHGGFTLDGSLTAAGNGNINGNQFLSQASVTYNF